MDCRCAARQGENRRMNPLDQTALQVQGLRVQQVAHYAPHITCKSNLETRDQSALGLLNTCLTCDACGSIPRGSYPFPANAGDGDFHQPLNRGTASRHTVRRNMAGPLLGGAGASAARRQQYPLRSTEGKRTASLCGGWGFLSGCFSFSRADGTAFGWPLSVGGWGFLLFSLSFSSLFFQGF